MSFSVRIPLSLSSCFISKLPTLFFTMVLAHILRSVSGVTWIKFLVIRSPTLIPVSMILLSTGCLYILVSIFR